MNIVYRRTLKPEVVEDFCGTSYQCKFDYSMTLNKEYGHWTKYYQSQFVEMKDKDLKPGNPFHCLNFPPLSLSTTFITISSYPNFQSFPAEP